MGTAVRQPAKSTEVRDAVSAHRWIVVVVMVMVVVVVVVVVVAIIIVTVTTRAGAQSPGSILNTVFVRPFPPT